MAVDSFQAVHSRPVVDSLLAEDTFLLVVDSRLVRESRLVVDSRPVVDSRLEVDSLLGSLYLDLSNGRGKLLEHFLIAIDELQTRVCSFLKKNARNTLIIGQFFKVKH